MIKQIKQQAKSRTMRFFSVLLVIESLAVSFTYLEPFFTADEFMKITAFIGFLSHFGGMYYRQKTNQSIQDK